MCRARRCSQAGSAGGLQGGHRGPPLVSGESGSSRRCPTLGGALVAPDLPSARLGPLPLLLLPSVTPWGALLCPGACDTVSATPLPLELVAVRAVGAQLDVKERQCLLSGYMAARQRHRAELTLGYNWGYREGLPCVVLCLGELCPLWGLAALAGGLSGALAVLTGRGPAELARWSAGGNTRLRLWPYFSPVLVMFFFYPTYGA